VTGFTIDSVSLAASRERAVQLGRAGAGHELVARLRAGDTLRDEELAVLLLSREVPTGELLALAGARLGDRALQIETFCPLYISNECDAECRMCGMRRLNQSLHRETADEVAVQGQLDILYSRGIRGVALLAGEYRHGSRRHEMLARTSSALAVALERGFTHVLINVGSLETEEYRELLAPVERGDEGELVPHITMSTFQETYDPRLYQKFMGSSPDNPRADFERRLHNFDRAHDAGVMSANPGVLVGLNRDLAYEMLALIDHARYLSRLGMRVYVSLPRLRKADGAKHRVGVDDDSFCRLVALVSAALPDASVVISTRESPEIQHRLLPVIGVLTAGSPGVAPYTEVGARFELEASQFEVADQRPFEDILRECLAAGAVIQGYEPTSTPASGW
jgi:2-iminoacetate synthase